MGKKTGVTSARNIPFYLTKEDVPEVHRDKKYIYTPIEDERIVLPKSFTGINYQNYSKIDLINLYITMFNRSRTVEQSLSEMTVRNAILQDRLVLNGLPTSMDLEELKTYRVTLEMALHNTIENLRTKLPQDIRYMIEQKVIEEIRRTQLEQGMSLEYQVFEISRQLQINLEMQSDTASSHDEPNKKATSIQRLQQTYGRLVELMAKLKETAKDIDEAFNGKPENEKREDIYNDDDDDDDLDIDFSGFGKKE